MKNINKKRTYKKIIIAYYNVYIYLFLLGNFLKIFQTVPCKMK
ncbi:hypothetical protein PFMALIP_05572 [Plasmodium falciparum MaliPS096_E11]|uniref:Uncharacterized protein n=1 Tax=Plasmodium falciparum MaliPS096_E11 TaxID=1036727 RepID=A0A024WGK8_PLAFA|nr:hypothetical protein PFMALIP_05572 [Plasmodium falciparum MaliPS096_E11]